GGIGQRLDAAVIDVAAAVEDDLLDTGLQRALGEQLADLGRRRLVGPGLVLALEVLVDRGGLRERHPLRVVDDLGVDVLLRAEYGQPRTAARILTDTIASA